MHTHITVIYLILLSFLIKIKNLVEVIKVSTEAFAFKFNDGRLEIFDFIAPNKTYNFKDKFNLSFIKAMSYRVIIGTAVASNDNLFSPSVNTCVENKRTGDSLYIDQRFFDNTLSSSFIHLHLIGFWK